MSDVLLSPPVKDGVIPFTYQGETFQTYFKIFSGLENRTHILVVCLHGEPGLSHDYLLPLGDLASKGIPIILYDQIGNARSTHLRDRPQTFWTIDLFIDELVNLLAHFGISDAFDLIRHSWGGVLATEFELHLNMQLMQAMPPEVQSGLQRGMKETKKYEAALKFFHAKHGCTVKPFPAEVKYSLDQIFGQDGDAAVASAPILKDWSAVDRLRFVRVPTFVINGHDDISQDAVDTPFFQKIPEVKWVTFEQSSHMPFWEERERYMQLVSDFLDVSRPAATAREQPKPL
ncbi:proline iminopeptidase [Obba rivulosa]|uniref:Proline iminopeptidase n=1 Tax=Obba rivulosa TaxID=1052685 RepID=A0A8E2DQ50_9APHY|nr:proline iminopeptidase [Obba rivulosa]